MSSQRTSWARDRTTTSVLIRYNRPYTTQPVYCAGSFTHPPWTAVRMDCQHDAGTAPAEYIKVFNNVSPGRHFYKFRVGREEQGKTTVWLADHEAEITLDVTKNRVHVINVTLQPSFPLSPYAEPFSSLPKVMGYTVPESSQQPALYATPGVLHPNPEAYFDASTTPTSYIPFVPNLHPHSTRSSIASPSQWLSPTQRCSSPAHSDAITPFNPRQLDLVRVTGRAHTPRHPASPQADTGPTKLQRAVVRGEAGEAEVQVKYEEEEQEQAEKDKIQEWSDRKNEQYEDQNGERQHFHGEGMPLVKKRPQ